MRMRGKAIMHCFGPIANNKQADKKSEYTKKLETRLQKPKQISLRKYALNYKVLHLNIYCLTYLRWKERNVIIVTENTQKTSDSTTVV